MEASVEARSALAAKRDAEVEAKFERKLAALQAFEERLLSAARDEASRVAEEKASIVADERAARVARDAAAEVGNGRPPSSKISKEAQEEVTDASRRVDAKFAELDEKLSRRQPQGPSLRGRPSRGTRRLPHHQTTLA